MKKLRKPKLEERMTACLDPESERTVLRYAKLTGLSQAGVLRLALTRFLQHEGYLKTETRRARKAGRQG